ncbi:MAG: GFA family protein, partial [Longimicrobiales bacterium]
MKIEGACHCGEIRYEAEVDPEKVALCNCTDCQTLSGSAFRVNVFVDESNLRFLSGDPVEYVKTGESGNQRAQAFCGVCGTGLYATSAGEGPRVYGLRVGTSSQRDQLVPKGQAWLRSRLDWLSALD